FSFMTPTATLPSGWRLAAFDDIGSTNDEAKHRAVRDDAPEGTVVWARSQSAGRGREDRAWVSPPGNLYCSVILRPACPLERAAHIGFAAALAVAEAVEDAAPGVRPSLKWPN